MQKCIKRCALKWLLAFRGASFLFIKKGQLKQGCCSAGLFFLFQNSLFVRYLAFSAEMQTLVPRRSDIPSHREVPQKVH